MAKKELCLVLVIAAGIIMFATPLAGGGGSLLPFDDSREVLVREITEDSYVLPLEKIMRGNLAHPDDPMPLYSVPLEGIPLSGLAYIRPMDWLVLEGRVEKNTLSWAEGYSSEEVFDFFQQEMEKRGGEILEKGSGEAWEKWGTWHRGFYPLEKREDLIKETTDLFYLAGKLKEEGRVRYFSLAVFQSPAAVGGEVFAQLDTIETHQGELVDKLIEETPRLMDFFDVPGVGIALVEEGEVKWKRFFGHADREKEIPLNREHLFRVGSISKPVLAWGIINLVENGQIKLDEPAEKHLTRWEIPPGEFPSDEVTIRKILSHTAGLPSAIGGGYPPGEKLPSLEEILAGEGSMSPTMIENKPGESFHYSNPGYVLLELLIEEVTGYSFQTYITAEILEPLGMEESTFTWSEELQERIATGYLLDNSPAPLEIDAAKGPGALYSTLGDMSRFLAAGVQKENQGVLAPENLEMLFTPQAETGSFYALISDYYGLGYYLETLPSGEKGVFHGGQHTGWLASMYGVPETGDGIVILTNSERSQPLIARLLGIWAAGKGYETVKMSRTYSTAETIIRGGIIILFLTSLGGIIYLGKGIVRKDRNFAPFSPKNLFIRGILILGFLVLWGPLFWATGQKMVRVFLPVLSTYMGIAFLFAGLVLLVGAVFPLQEKRNN